MNNPNILDFSHMPPVTKAQYYQLMNIDDT